MNSRHCFTRAFVTFATMTAMFGFSACALFEDIPDPEGSADSDTTPVVEDYWYDGRCPVYHDPTTGQATDSLVSEDCRGITEEGCCDGAGSIIYCKTLTQKLQCAPCANGSESCSWESVDDINDDYIADDYYWCTMADNGEDPEGVHPRSCEQALIDGLACQVRNPKTCADIHPTDPEQQRFGCCEGGKAYTCDNGNLKIASCTGNTVCAYDSYYLPGGISCVAPPGGGTRLFNPRACGRIPTSCEDISADEYEQMVGCCADNTAFRCLPDDDNIMTLNFTPCAGAQKCLPLHVDFPGGEGETLTTAAIFCR